MSPLEVNFLGKSRVGREALEGIMPRIETESL